MNWAEAVQAMRNGKRVKRQDGAILSIEDNAFYGHNLEGSKQKLAVSDMENVGGNFSTSVYEVCE